MGREAADSGADGGTFMWPNNAQWGGTPIYGTMEASANDAPKVEAGIKAALKCGYRAFDLAEHYQSSKGGHVGTALAEGMAAEGCSREELWLTHKIDGMPTGEYAAVKARVTRMLELARTTYLDCLLIHYPAPAGTDLSGDPAGLSTPERWAWFAEHIEGAWANMSRLRAEGLVRHVGVSNFYRQHLNAMDAFVDRAEHAPIYANQVWMEAAHPQADLVRHCQSKGIVVMAYRPTVFLTLLGLLEGGVLLERLQAAAGRRRLESPHQLVLQDLALRGCVPITGSLDASHLAANFKAVADALRPGAEGGVVGDEDRDGLHDVAQQQEMVDMMGGIDEYADGFSRMGPKASC